MLRLCLIAAAHALVLSVSDAPGLLTTLADAADGDIIELAAGEYALPAAASGILLALTRPVTLRTALADAPARAVLRAASADETDVLIGVGASDVTLENLVFARPLSGTPRNVDRTIDVLVSAGTQQQPSVLAVGGYEGTPAARKRRAPMGAVHAARRLGKSKRSLDTATRGLLNITLRALDFSASYSHSELVFDSGAYIGVAVERCAFGAAATNNAVVTLGGSHFDAATSLVALSSFAGAPLVLNGDGLTIGTNYWAAAPPAAPATYCVDTQCATLGPVTDGATAYASVAAALAAGAGHVRVTAPTALLAADGECAVAWREATVIEGAPVADCAGGSVATLLVSSHGACPAALVAIEGALAGVSNVRFELASDVRVGVALLPAYAAYTAVPGEQQTLFDNVTFIGEQTATAVLHQGASTRLTLHESTFIGVGTAVDLRGGDLAVADSAFVANEAGAIAVAPLTTPDTRGLRISGATFVGSSKGSVVVGVASARLHEFYVACNRFIFAPFVAPTDCAASGSTCQNAIRHNTMIDEPALLTADARRVLVRGANHIAEAPAAALAQYAQFRRAAATHQQFDLLDAQGRLDSVTATVNTPATWQYMLATYAPMRAECFAGALPTSSDPLAPARVVSNLFELRSDAPPECISIALRATLSDANATQHDGEDVAFYSVAHLGDQGSGQWQRAAVHSVLTPDGTSVTIEASSGSGALTRAVAVAVHASPAEAAASLATGVVAVRAAARRLCVACGSDRLPAYVVDERCGGNTEQNVYDDFDAALAAARRANALRSSVSLLVYGTQCTAAQCSYELPGGASFTLEGLGVTARGTLRRARTDCSSGFLSATAAGVTVRNLLLPERDACLVSAPSNERASGPLLAFLTLGGSVCVGARFDVSLVGNELSAGAVFNGTSVARVEQNSFGGSLLLDGVAQADVRNNTFAAGRVAARQSAVAYAANQFAGTQTACQSVAEVECTPSATSAFCACLASVFAVDAALPAISQLPPTCQTACAPASDLTPQACAPITGAGICSAAQQRPNCGVCLAFNTTTSLCEMPLDAHGARPLCASVQCGAGAFNVPCQCDAECACPYVSDTGGFEPVTYALCTVGQLPPLPPPDAGCQVSCAPATGTRVSPCAAASMLDVCAAAGSGNTEFCGICQQNAGAFVCRLPPNQFGTATFCESAQCVTPNQTDNQCGCGSGGGGNAVCACFYASAIAETGYDLCQAPAPAPTPPAPTCTAACPTVHFATPLAKQCAPLASDVVCVALNLTAGCGECITLSDNTGACQLPPDVFGVKQTCPSADCADASEQGEECTCVACGCLYGIASTPGVDGYTLCREEIAPTCNGVCGANTSSACVTLTGTEVAGICNQNDLCEFLDSDQQFTGTTCVAGAPCTEGEACFCAQSFSDCFCADAVEILAVPTSVLCLSDDFAACGGTCNADKSSNCVERVGKNIRGICQEGAYGGVCALNTQNGSTVEFCLSETPCGAIGDACQCADADPDANGCFCARAVVIGGVLVDQQCATAPEPPCTALCSTTADGNCSTKTGAEILGFCLAPRICTFWNGNITASQCKSSSPCDVAGDECFCDLDTTLTGCFCDQLADGISDGFGVADAQCNTQPQVPPTVEPTCATSCSPFAGTNVSACGAGSSAGLCQALGFTFELCGRCAQVNGKSVCTLDPPDINGQTQSCSASAQCASAADNGRPCFCEQTCACLYRVEGHGGFDNVSIVGYQLCEQTAAPSSSNTGLFIFLGVFLGLMLLLLIAAGVGFAFYYATAPSRTPPLPPPFVPAGGAMRVQVPPYAPADGAVSGFNLDAVAHGMRRRKDQ